MDLHPDLVRLVLDYAPRNRVDLPSARLYHDLDISGDDAGSLLTDYSKKFNVDMRAIKFEEFFPNEGDHFLQGLVRMLRGEKVRFKELTVGDLQLGIERGALSPSGADH